MNKEQLLAICPKTHKVDVYLPLFNEWMSYYSINVKLRIAAFIAQVLHESDKLFYTKEIASGKDYEFRKSLGNVIAGDGPKYKGRGFIQITGRANYAAVSKGLGVDFVNHPELLEEPRYAVQSACWWWSTHGLNKLADSGKFEAITRIINGGLNGYTERLEYYNKALKVLK